MANQEKLSEKEQEEIVERASPPGEIVYHAVNREGEHELKRLWAVVLLTNLIGAFLFAWFMARSNTFDEHVRATFLELGQSAMQHSFTSLLLGGIVGGWLIALMIWLLPFAEAARIWVIIILAYVIGLGYLPHVIAGSVETFYLVADGALPFSACIGRYLLPVLIGNVIGGVALVAISAHTEFVEASQ